MHKVSEIIGKIAITLSGALCAGTVLDVYFDASMEKCRLLSLIGEDDELFWVDFKNVISAGSDAVVIKNPQDIMPFPLPQSCFKCPINLSAYNQDGLSLGIIRDLIIDGDKVAIFVAGLEIPSSTIISHSDSAAVFNDTGLPLKIKKPAVTAKKPRAGEGNSTYVSTDLYSPNKTADAGKNQKTPKTDAAEKTSKANKTTGNSVKDDNITPADPDEVGLPFKLPLENITLLPNSVINTTAQNKYAFLVGKKLSRTIYTSSGRLIARENETVSEEIILKAKNEGKLMSLALHSI